MISVQHISMQYKIDIHRIQTFKEYFVRLMKRQLQYQLFNALCDVSFTVNRGEVVGLIGRNGAGKSTALKIISGILKPTGGNVQVEGRIVPMLELGSGFDPELTGHENIYLNGSILGYSRDFINSKYKEIIDFAELGDFIYSPMRTYSSGMLMRLAFSVAAFIDPEVMIVDEILAVGDASFQEKSMKRMLDLMGSGTTVLFVSHSITQVRELCSRVVWLEQGKVKMIGAADEVCDAYEKG